MGRRPNTQMRRAQIADGLKTVMAADGFDRASTAAIARAAGLAPGLVHYHFDDKEAVLVLLVERIEAALFERIARHSTGAPWDALDACLDGLLSTDQDTDPQAVACWVQLGALSGRSERVGAVYRAAQQRLVDVLAGHLAAVVATSQQAHPPVDAMAAALLCVVEGAFAVAVASPGLVPAGSAATMAKAMARGLVAGGPG